MPDIKVNTRAVGLFADNLKGVNNRIRDRLPQLNNSVKSLDNVWDGPAASAVMAKFGEIKGKYESERYKAIDNYVKFLKTQIGEGYEQTEDVNTKLAEQFK